MKDRIILGLFVLSFGGCTSWKMKAPGDGSSNSTQHESHFSSLKPVDKEKDLKSFTRNSEDEEDTANTDNPEGTPEDLGDIEFSNKRRAEEINADALASKTFPLVYNEFVEQWIKYFTGRGRSTFERWLSRSTRYIPAMKEVLRKEGLPEDLIYLSMIESGFNPKAASHAKAVGPWQFIKGTGQRYNLEVGYWLDQRRDFIKSTFAAGKYLKELHQIFGSWYLAAASYNAGEGKVLNAVRNNRSRNFWELCRTKKNFRAETRNYVPKIIAAALISKSPEKYGFSDIPYENPFNWSQVRVPAGVDLRAVAEIIQTDKEELLILNSELRRGITPPQDEGYDIKVPPDKKEILVAHLSELKSQKLNKYFAIHRVKKGDTIASIARRYDSNTQTILELNDIKKKQRLRIGMEISVPLSENPPKKNSVKKLSLAEKSAPAQGKSASPRSSPLQPAEMGAKSSTPVSPGSTYVIQDGDTLWALSQKWRVPLNSLKKANNIHSARSLQPGKTLVIPN